VGARHEHGRRRLLSDYWCIPRRYIEFSYPEFMITISRGAHVGQGHRRWRYDEFRLSDSGRVVQELNGLIWQGNRWLMQAPAGCLLSSRSASMIRSNRHLGTRNLICDTNHRPLLSTSDCLGQMRPIQFLNDSPLSAQTQLIVSPVAVS